jgi:phosphatidylglycerophosphate synthase
VGDAQQTRLVLRPSELFNLAGALTLVRLPLAVLFPLIAHDTLTALMVYLAAVVSDALDGPVARHTGTVSQIGAFADGWLDKIFHIQAAWALYNVELIPAWWMWLWFSREVVQGALVPWYVRRYMKGAIPPNKPLAVGRVTAVALAGAFVLSILGLPDLAFPLTLVCGIGGLLSAFGYLRRELEDHSIHR